MGGIAEQQQSRALPAGRQPRAQAQPQRWPHAGGGQQAAPERRQLGRSAAGPAFRPGDGGASGTPLLQPPQPHAAAGGAEQGVAAGVADQGGEAAGDPGLQVGRSFVLQLKPEHLQGRVVLVQLQSRQAPDGGAAAIAAHHQISRQLGAVVEHHACHPGWAFAARQVVFRLQQQFLHRPAPPEGQIRAGQGLLQHPFQQGRRVDQAAGHGSTERLGHREQAAALQQEAPAPQLPPRQRGQQGSQAHAVQGLKTARHQAIAADQGAVARLTLYELHGHAGAGQEQGEGATGGTGAHHHHRQRRGAQVKEL